MAKLYVGCALTHASQEFKDAVENLKKLLRLNGHEVLDFLGQKAGSAEDVYRMDIKKCVAQCEAMIGICDLPSLGLGWEMATAVEKHRKPTLAVAHRQAEVSRLILGVECYENPLFAFRRYDQLNDVVNILSKFLKEVGVAV